MRGDRTRSDLTWPQNGLAVSRKNRPHFDRNLFAIHPVTNSEDFKMRGHPLFRELCRIRWGLMIEGLLGGDRLVRNWNCGCIAVLSCRWFCHDGGHNVLGIRLQVLRGTEESAGDSDRARATRGRDSPPLERS